MSVDKEKIQSILATDCGSTTTKAILIEKIGDEFRLMVRGEAPTTVEAPVEDVTRGVINAVSEVQELAGRPLLEGEDIIKPQRANGDGVDIYISTSSAGGGLQMMVAGVVKQMTAESAERAALGAGAIVMDVIASNDGRLAHQKTERIRKLRPDMILLSGGTDSGNIRQVVELAEIITAADPKPRLGTGYELPVIFAGNIKARDEVKKRLDEKTALVITDNLRPSLEEENLMPARLEIQDQFLEHVMSHAPGYKTLMLWTDVDIMPTPAAVGYIMERIAKERGIQVVGVDIGGATTDVFSVFQGIFNRTVSANYGMSYSISNVFADSGMDNIMRWVPFDIDEKDLRNRIKNKMIRPTSIPQTLEELMIEQALAREALSLSFLQHKALATGLKGVHRERTIADAFDQTASGDTLVDLMGLNMLIGSGGVLSHAPRRSQSAWMLMDAFLPEGITQLTVDSIFMMPQLGVLAQVHPEAATQVFVKDCLIYLGTCVAPVGPGKDGRQILTGKISLPGGREIEVDLKYGELQVIPLEAGLTANAELNPAKGFDLGEGKGKKIETTLYGGVVGIVLDGRGRQPFTLPKDKEKRIEKLHLWADALNAYPKK
ncbi:MAG: glutamate mutase L [Chloroflexi bacterium]|nr:glutamate mutase L [Chloroflexota bacterium]